MKMKKLISILGILFIFYCHSIVALGGGDELEYIQEAALSEAYCSIDEFEELNYYLFCDSQLHEGAGGFMFRPCIIGGETRTIEEAKQLYRKFIEKIPLDSAEEGEENNAFYISPDCKWVIMNKWNEHKTISTQMLFYEKEKVREKVTEARNGFWNPEDEQSQ